MRFATLKAALMVAPLAPLALLAACGGASPEAEAAADATATVKTASAVLGATPDTVGVFGVAEAGPGAERAMSVQAEAVMERIVAPTGTAVRAGAVVAILRPSPTSRLDASKAASDLAAADAAYARAKRLRADGLVSDADVETARAAAASAGATRAATAQRNGTLVLHAPTAGTVQTLTAKPGDVIAAGTTVATIGATGEMRARFGVDPSVAVRVHPGQPIQLSTINGGSTIESTVSGVDPQVDATTRLASVFARVPAGQGIGPGAALRGSIRVGGTANGITIPYAALLDDGGHSYVFVVQGGVAKKRDVSPGSSTGDTIAILKGLAPGEKVVTEGGTALDDGMKVSEDATARAQPSARKANRT